MRLYTRLEVLYTDELVRDLLQELLKIMEENTETIMPGFTHLAESTAGYISTPCWRIF